MAANTAGWCPVCQRRMETSGGVLARHLYGGSPCPGVGQAPDAFQAASTSPFNRATTSGNADMAGGGALLGGIVLLALLLFGGVVLLSSDTDEEEGQRTPSGASSSGRSPAPSLSSSGIATQDPQYNPLEDSEMLRVGRVSRAAVVLLWDHEIEYGSLGSSASYSVVQSAAAREVYHCALRSSDPAHDDYLRERSQANAGAEGVAHDQWIVENFCTQVDSEAVIAHFEKYGID